MEQLTGFSLTVCPYRPENLAAVKALDARVDAYRLGDEAAVEAMYARAAEAERAGDRWTPIAPESLPEDIDDIEASYLEFWVAASEAGEVGGIVGVRGRLDPVLLAGLTDAAAWLDRDDIAELCHLRVAPERWRQGLGRGLVRAVIDWAVANGYRSLVLNTTTPQTPAIRLYESLGFGQAGISYFGPYELVWMALDLVAARQSRPGASPHRSP